MSEEAAGKGSLPVPNPAPLDDPRLVAFARVLTIVDALRGPDGCPWDREQTEQSMAPHLVEEAHELIDAIETGTAAQSASEAGDVLIALTLTLRVAQDAGRYDMAQAATLAAEKLVRRHPHVFQREPSGADPASASAVVRSWEATKRAEREAAGEDTSALAGIPVTLPALQRASRMCRKAVAAGFHWKNARGALGKLEEELDELRAELPADLLEDPARPGLPPAARARVEEELGDVLMAAAFLGGYLDLDPEALVRRALRRFEARFRHMESQLGGTLAGRDLDTMMDAWRIAKRETQDDVPSRTRTDGDAR